MNYKKLLICLLSMFTLNTTLIAQNYISPSQADAHTYALYLQRDWKQLLAAGKACKTQNIDFLFLDYRMAIAYFELKKYGKAIPIFEKLHQSAPQDSTLKEYLYFSYYNAGRYSDAQFFEKQLSENHKTKLGLHKQKIIDAAWIDLFGQFFDDYTEKKSYGKDIAQSSVKSQYYFGLGLEQQIKSRFILLHGLSYINIRNISQHQIIEQLPPVFDELVKQYEYVSSLNTHIGKGFNIFLTLHFLNTQIDAENPQYALYGSGLNKYLYQVQTNSMAACIGLSKRISVIETELSLSASSLNKQKQLQPELSVILFPLNNYRLYTKSTVTALFHHTESNNQKEQNFVVKQSLGLFISSQILSEATVTYGKLNNYTEQRAFVVNNDLDPIQIKSDISLSLFNKSKTGQLFIKYSYIQKENTYLMNNETETKKYFINQITGGIKWYF